MKYKIYIYVDGIITDVGRNDLPYKYTTKVVLTTIAGGNYGYARYEIGEWIADQNFYPALAELVKGIRGVIGTHQTQYRIGLLKIDNDDGNEGVLIDVMKDAGVHSVIFVKENLA